MVKRSTLGEEDESSELSASPIPWQCTMQTTTPTKEVTRRALEVHETSDLSMRHYSLRKVQNLFSREEAIDVNYVLQSPSSAKKLLQLSNIEHFVNIEAIDSSDVFVQSCALQKTDTVAQYERQ